MKISELEEKLADTLTKLGFEELEVLFSFILLKQEKTNILTLLNYIDFKRMDNGDFNIIDLLCFIDHAGKDIERFMPNYSYVKYIGKTTKELKTNTIYSLEYVIGVDRKTFKIKNDLNRVKGYKSSLFIPQLETNVIYNGESNKNLKYAEEYEVKQKDGIEYTFTNEEKAIIYECEPIEFVDTCFDNFLTIDEFDYSNALLLAKLSFEFGKVMEMYQYMNKNCKYKSISKDETKTLSGRKTICTYIKNISKKIVRSNALLKAEFISIDKVDDIDLENGFNEGDLVMLLTYSNSFKQVVRLDLKNNKINEICLFDKIPIGYSKEHIDYNTELINQDFENFKSNIIN